MSSELRVNRIIPVNGVPTGGGGGIIQIVNATYTTAVNSTATGVTDIFSASITPTSSSNKIMVIATSNLYINRGTAQFPSVGLVLKRGATTVSLADQGRFYFDNRSFGTLFGQQLVPATLTILDSPATTSSTTYTLAYTASFSSGSCIIGIESPSTLCLMEVSG